MTGGEGWRERATERQLWASKQHCTCIKAMWAEVMVSRDALCIMQHLLGCTSVGKCIFHQNKQRLWSLKHNMRAYYAAQWWSYTICYITRNLSITPPGANTSNCLQKALVSWRWGFRVGFRNAAPHSGIIKIHEAAFNKPHFDCSCGRKCSVWLIRAFFLSVSDQQHSQFTKHQMFERRSIHISIRIKWRSFICMGVRTVLYVVHNVKTDQRIRTDALECQITIICTGQRREKEARGEDHTCISL